MPRNARPSSPRVRWTPERRGAGGVGGPGGAGGVGGSGGSGGWWWVGPRVDVGTDDQVARREVIVTWAPVATPAASACR